MTVSEMRKEIGRIEETMTPEQLKDWGILQHDAKNYKELIGIATLITTEVPKEM